jgi:hypothetical protein
LREATAVLGDLVDRTIPKTERDRGPTSATVPTAMRARLLEK